MSTGRRFTENTVWRMDRLEGNRRPFGTTQVSNAEEQGGKVRLVYHPWHLGRLMMGRPAGIEIVRRAYELWEQAGKPEGRDQEFYLQAERELQEAQDQPKETPEDI